MSFLPYMFRYRLILANTALPTAPNFSGSWWYWFGTTYSRIPILPVMLGALRFDLTYTVKIVFIGMAVGVMIGSMAGNFGGIFDEIVMRITDIFFSLPFRFIFTSVSDFTFILATWSMSANMLKPSIKTFPPTTLPGGSG